MEQGRQNSVEPGPSRREALAGLLLVQLAVGYEWFASGLSKLIRGDFPGGLADELREKSEMTAGWYRSFLDSAVIPHSLTFGYLVELGELVIGLALMGAALAWLLARGRLRRRGYDTLVSLILCRLDELRGAGCEGSDCGVLAGRLDVDLGRAVELVGRGCAPDLALRILL